MATIGKTYRESFIAGEDLSSSQFTFVKMNTTDRTVVAAGNGDAVAGILYNEPASGEAATVVISGRMMVLCGTGGLTAGADVGVDANGAAVVAATGDVIVGQCVDGASATEYATIDLFRGGNASA